MSEIRTLSRMDKFFSAKRGPKAKATGRRYLMNLRQAAEFVGVSAETLRDWIKAGRLEAFKRYVGGEKADPRSWRWMIPEPALMRFMGEWLFTGATLSVPPNRRSLPPRGPDGKFLPCSSGDPPGGQGGC
jgi:hypothetical protein